MQDPPRGWPRKPVFNPPGGPPGPPIQWGDELTNETVEPGFGYIGTGAIPENDQYFYHPDHLGSTAYVTNVTGAVCQFFVYLPYGETLIDKHSSPWKVPYTFSAKEQDVETKLTYFEARYYDAKYTTFLSVDPMWMKYPGISAYAYCANNPIKYTDPEGKQIRPGNNGSNRAPNRYATPSRRVENFQSFRYVTTYASTGMREVVSVPLPTYVRDIETAGMNRYQISVGGKEIYAGHIELADVIVRTAKEYFFDGKMNSVRTREYVEIVFNDPIQEKAYKEAQYRYEQLFEFCKSQLGEEPKLSSGAPYEEVLKHQQAMVIWLGKLLQLKMDLGPSPRERLLEMGKKMMEDAKHNPKNYMKINEVQIMPEIRQGS